MKIHLDIAVMEVQEGSEVWAEELIVEEAGWGSEAEADSGSEAKAGSGSEMALAEELVVEEASDSAAAVG